MDKLAVATKNSLPSGASLYANHCYVVIAIFDDGGTPKAPLYNPHGKVDDILISKLHQSVRGGSYQAVGGP
ncbi:MAG TPA: hypothetical protein VMP01_27575 [Pirellulaceae bacterium]|nr:hypothetical protein [Pirellulaceae bacterium]